MPWERKEESQTAPAQSPVDNYPYPTVTNLMALTGWAVFFSIVATIAFGLLLGYARTTFTRSEDHALEYYSTISYNDGFTAGVVLIVIAAFASFIIGLVMLIRSWSPLLAREHGLIVAMGIVTFLGCLIFVALVLGLVLLSRLTAYNDTPLAEKAPPEQPPPPQLPIV